MSVNVYKVTLFNRVTADRVHHHDTLYVVAASFADAVEVVAHHVPAAAVESLTRVNPADDFPVLVSRSALPSLREAVRDP